MIRLRNRVPREVKGSPENDVTKAKLDVVHGPVVALNLLSLGMSLGAKVPSMHPCGALSGPQTA